MIYRFKYTHDFLTNFYDKSIFIYKGIKWNTSEATFQAMKSHDPEEWKRFSLMKPGTSKREGRKLDLAKSWGSPAEWNKVAPEVMYDIVKAKFEVPENKELLLSTGNEYLIEGTGGPGFHGAWHDRLWGVCRCQSCSSKLSSNLLGNILMKVRAELQGKEYDKPFETIAPYGYIALPEEYLDEMILGQVLTLPTEGWTYTLDRVDRKAPILVVSGYLPCTDLGKGNIKSLRDRFKIVDIKTKVVNGVTVKLVDVNWPSMG